MKRFIGILCCAIAFSACDDGDLIVDTINFDEVATSTCGDANNLLFKLKDSESLLLNLPEDIFEKTFKEEPTADNTRIELDINSKNQVVYNFYDGKVGTVNVCDLIPPAIPSVKTQWKASSGVIEVTTETVKTLNETDNSTKITGYKHNIIFTNITFAKGDGTTQFYKSFIFGDYLKNITPLALAFKEELNICDSDLVYNSNGTESLTLNIDPTLIDNVVTPVDKPRRGTIESVKNKLVYRTYENGVLQPSYFCQTTDPSSPTVKEEWLGKAGGIIEVTTTTSGPGTFKHTIVLKNVTLEKGNSNFQLGNNYSYGELQK
jgi:hypothetical protein|nr:hypothetical protein [uncultured Flavobacterium sp.]